MATYENTQPWIQAKNDENRILQQAIHITS